MQLKCRLSALIQGGFQRQSPKITSWLAQWDYLEWWLAQSTMEGKVTFIVSIATNHQLPFVSFYSIVFVQYIIRFVLLQPWERGSIFMSYMFFGQLAQLLVSLPQIWGTELLKKHLKEDCMCFAIDLNMNSLSELLDEIWLFKNKCQKSKKTPWTPEPGPSKHVQQSVHPL